MARNIAQNLPIFRLHFFSNWVSFHLCNWVYFKNYFYLSTFFILFYPSLLCSHVKSLYLKYNISTGHIKHKATYGGIIFAQQNIFKFGHFMKKFRFRKFSWRFTRSNKTAPTFLHNICLGWAAAVPFKQLILKCAVGSTASFVSHLDASSFML